MNYRASFGLVAVVYPNKTGETSASIFSQAN